jgi:hypothetical protein
MAKMWYFPVGFHKCSAEYDFERITIRNQKISINLSAVNLEFMETGFGKQGTPSIDGLPKKSP